MKARSGLISTLRLSVGGSVTFSVKDRSDLSVDVSNEDYEEVVDIFRRSSGGTDSVQTSGVEIVPPAQI